MKKGLIKIGLLSLITIVGLNNISLALNQKSVEVIQKKVKTETFKVFGNCGMCESTIEGALKGVKGIEKADWNKDTKMIEVTFDENVISLKQIKQKIADVGYDTEEIKATEKSYNKLPGCCQYERPKNNE